MKLKPHTGSVYCDDNFRFSDGKIGKKLFIVMALDCVDDNQILVAKTTSKPKSDLALACFPDQLPPSYCIPKTHTSFTVDTWIVLDELYCYEAQKFWDKNLDKLFELSLIHI